MGAVVFWLVAAFGVGMAGVLGLPFINELRAQREHKRDNPQAHSTDALQVPTPPRRVVRPNEQRVLRALPNKHEAEEGLS